MIVTQQAIENHRRILAEMDSKFGGNVEIDTYTAFQRALLASIAELEAKYATLQETAAADEKYIAAIPALCRGEDVPCAMHISEPIKKLRARIAELEQMVLEWQPIETAPRDGERDMLLGYWWRNPFAHDTAQPIFKQCVGRWTDFNGGGWITANGGNVTHWQPLPQPPRKDGAK